MSYIPEEVFKRRPRHNNTPGYMLLIITNSIVFFINITLFTGKNHVNWFFWVVIALLALYNFFTVKRNLDDFNKTITLAYVLSVLLLVVVFFLFKGKA